MVEFWTKLYEIITLPPKMLHEASGHMFDFQYSETVLYQYLGFLHYAMGTPLYTIFSTIAVIGIAAMLWSIVVKVFALIMEIIPFA